MFLGPKHHWHGQAVKHFFIGSLATSGSNSFSAAGTGFAWMPFYAWCTASALGSFMFWNGTGASLMFQMKAASGGVSEAFFYEEPSKMAANKFPVLESSDGVGASDFHVFCVLARSGAGDNALKA